MDTAILRTDGGSRGNPGPAGFGAVLLTQTNEIIGTFTGYLGEATNNVAEYRGLIAGLHAARARHITELEVELDSVLIVNQLNGKWKIKHEAIKPLATAAQQLIRQFKKITFTWIPREKNTIADSLANLAMDTPNRYHVDESDYASFHQVEGTPSSHNGTSSPREENYSPTKESPDNNKDHLVTPADTATHTVTEKRSIDNQPLTPGWGNVPSNSTRFILLRHGQIPLSVERRLAGTTTQSLTSVGQAQMHAAGHFLRKHNHPIDAFYISPMVRCQESFDIVSQYVSDVPHYTDNRLQETDFGDWEGLTLEEVKQTESQLFSQWMQNTGVCPPHGESIDSTYARVQDFIREKTLTHPGATLLLCTHVGPIKAALGNALNVGTRIMFDIFLELASVSVIDVKASGKGYVRCINETAYLL